MKHYLEIAQMVCLAFATLFILLQNRGVGLSSTFGGKDEIYLTRRGMEKTIVTLTVVCIILFVVFRLVTLFY